MSHPFIFSPLMLEDEFGLIILTITGDRALASLSRKVANFCHFRKRYTFEFG